MAETENSIALLVLLGALLILISIVTSQAFLKARIAEIEVSVSHAPFPDEVNRLVGLLSLSNILI